MKLLLRDVRLPQIEQEMEDLSTRIRTSLADNPDDFDGREQLWMRREDLREERDFLMSLPMTWGQRLAYRLMGRHHTTMVGAMCSLTIIFEGRFFT